MPKGSIILYLWSELSQLLLPFWILKCILLFAFYISLSPQIRIHTHLFSSFFSNCHYSYITNFFSNFNCSNELLAVFSPWNKNFNYKSDTEMKISLQSVLSMVKANIKRESPILVADFLFVKSIAEGKIRKEKKKRKSHWVIFIERSPRRLNLLSCNSVIIFRWNMSKHSLLFLNNNIVECNEYVHV